LDALAVLGLCDTVAPGVAPGSDTAHLSLLGYPPQTYYRGRGAFESMGAGMHMRVGDVAFKCNFATLKDEVVVSRRCDRHFEEEGPILCAAIDGTVVDDVPGAVPVSVRCSYATEHRCGVVLRALDGKPLSDEVSGTDPLKDNLRLGRSEQKSGAREPERAAQTAAAINAVSDRICAMLETHPLNAERASRGKAPANVVLLRGCAARAEAPTFLERHGLRGCVLAPTRIIAGLAESVGMKVLPNPPGATGDYRTRLSAKVKATVEAVASGCYDFIFLHVKAIDDASHDSNLGLKVRFIEAADLMVGQLVRHLQPHGRCGLIVTGDHSTPVLYGDHSCEPVPFLATFTDNVWREYVSRYGEAEVIAMTDVEIEPPAEHAGVPEHASLRAASKDGNNDDTGAKLAFNEVSAARGYLGRFPGCEVMRIVSAMLESLTSVK